MRAGPQGHFYFPKIIRELFGNDLVLLPNSKAGVIYPENTTPEQVISSLEIIIQELKLRAKEGS